MTAKTLYIATSNPGKLRDFAAAADLHGYTIAPLPCLDRIPPPIENDLTFKGNACIKAIYYSRLAPGYDVIADDSGLEVDALNGDPGVRSARYAADNGFSGKSHDEANNSLLLAKLQSIPEKGRTARYRCALAYARDGECLLTAEGCVEGRIALETRGAGGFGYDPLFYLPGLGKTIAEIDIATKNSLSHRGRALQALLEQLRTLHSPV
jgi:XTP/dITP diphosphohydrolase